MQDETPELLELVDCLGKLMRSEMRQCALTHKLQPVHWQALSYLAQANRYSNTPQALTEYLGQTKGTVSQSLLLLYRRGLVERTPDPRDKRVVRLGLSEAGRGLLREFASKLDWQGVEPLPAEDARRASATLREVLRRMQKAHGGKTFGVCGTCAYCRHDSATAFRCGLTGEDLSPEETRRICREHKEPGR
jgi:DNA-binding MarR family transcriptional regulator